MMDAQGQLPEVSFTAEDVDQPMDDNNNDNAAGSDSNNEMNNNNEEQITEQEHEPDWDAIMQHEPARTEVPTFLTARGRCEAAGENFATGLDVLHSSVTESIHGLVEVVSGVLHDRSEKLYEYELALKNDYVSNDKTRASMNAKLEESARLAQGLFANLLMRVAQPEDGSSVGGGAGANSSLGGTGTGGTTNNSANPNDNNSSEGMGGDEEPDWDAIMQHEPARSEVPTFLSARGRRENACTRFETAIEQFQTEVDQYTQDLTQVVADVYNSRTMKLEEYETVLKNDYDENDKMRAKMQSSLEESAAAASNMFGELMNRVMNVSQSQHDQQMGGGMLTQAATLGESP